VKVEIKDCSDTELVVSMLGRFCVSSFTNLALYG